MLEELLSYMDKIELQEGIKVVLVDKIHIYAVV